MDIIELLKQMLTYPDAPKIYRELRDYYKSRNMMSEADAFTHLLKERYQELPVLDVNDSLVDKK